MAVGGLRKRQMTPPTLDHVGVVSHELTSLAAAYERLGFTLTPLARYADGRIGNRCIMLRQSYIELLAVIDPKASSATLVRFLARYAGIHILAFGIDAMPAAGARLRRAGIEASPSKFERVTDGTDAGSPRARFELLQLPDQPEGRLNLVRHLTPEVLWRECFLHHPNNAHDLTEVSLSVADPADTAGRFSRLVGCVVIPDATSGFGLELAHGRIRIMAANGEIVPRIVGVTVRTSDENATIRRLVSERGIMHGFDDGDLVIGSGAAGGVVLRFTPGLGSASP
jgi:hypothetical protein